MAFTKEEKKEVFAFFEKLLSGYNSPVYYESLRGFVSNASPIVKSYVKKECKGEKLLEFFKRRKNYFLVNGNDVFLINKKSNAAKQNLSVKVHKIKEKENTSIIEKNQDATNLSETKQLDNFDFDDTYDETYYEDITLKYFKFLLVNGIKINSNFLDAQRIMTLPSMVRYYLETYAKRDIKLFFHKFSHIFHIDENEYISLVRNDLNQSKKLDVNIAIETATQEPPKVPCDSSVEKVELLIKSLEFFATVINKKPDPCQIDKLSGYLSQAPEVIRNYIKYNYSNFKNMILDAPSIFLVNTYEEVSLSDNWSKLFKNIKKKIHKANKVPHILSMDLLQVYVSSILNPEKAAKSHSKFKKCDQALNSPSKLDLESDNLTDKESFVTDSEASESPSATSKPCLKYISTKSCSTENLCSIAVSKFKECDQGLHSPSKLDLERDNLTDKESFVTDSEATNSPSATSEPCSKCISTESSSTENLCSIAVSTCEHLASDDKLMHKKYNIPDTACIPAYCDFDHMKGNDFSEVKCSKANEYYSKNSKILLKIIEFLLTLQFLCLEILERDQKFDLETKKYFIKVLESKRGFCSEFSTLVGKLGEAPSNISAYVKKNYKGEKLLSFFETHFEFITKSHVVELRPPCKESSKPLQLYRNQNKVDILALCDSFKFLNMFSQAFLFLLDVCYFLQNKNAIKIERLNTIFSSSTEIQQNWIKGFKGNTVLEQLETCLRRFKLFQVLENSCIELNPELEISEIMKSLTELSFKIDIMRNSKKIDFNVLNECFLGGKENDSYIEKCDFLCEFVDCVNSWLRENAVMQYSDLPTILQNRSFLSRISAVENAKFLLNVLHESDMFLIENGLIVLKNISPDSETLFDNEHALSNTDMLSTETVTQSCSLQNKNLYFELLDCKSETESEDEIIDKRCNSIQKENSESSSSAFDPVTDTVDSFLTTSNSNVREVNAEKENVFHLLEEDFEIETSDKNLRNEIEIKSKINLGYENINPFALSSQKKCIDNFSNYKQKKSLVLSKNTSESKDLNISEPQHEIKLQLRDKNYKINDSENSNYHLENDSNNLRKLHQISNEENLSSVCQEIVQDEVKGATVLQTKDRNSGEFMTEFSKQMGKLYVPDEIQVENINCKTNICFSDKRKNDVHPVPINDSLLNKLQSNMFETEQVNEELVSNQRILSLQNQCISFLQPLIAEIKLLTYDSCIAQISNHDKHQNIFCMKSAFECNEHENCTDCFSLLKIGEKVECYVTTSEINPRILIAFMILKEASSEVITNENTNVNQSEEESHDYKFSEYKLDAEHRAQLHKTDSSQCKVQESLRKAECFRQFERSVGKTKIHSSNQGCQTDDNAYFGLSATTHDVQCQTAENQTTYCKATQTFYKTTENISQTDLISNVKSNTNVHEMATQTSNSVSCQKVDNLNVTDSDTTFTFVSEQMFDSKQLKHQKGTEHKTDDYAEGQTFLIGCTKKCPNAQYNIELSDSSCQTISTGSIITKYFFQ